MKVMESIKDISQALIEPLNEKTRALFAPLRFRPEDRLVIDIKSDNETFYYKVISEGREDNWYASPNAKQYFFNRLTEKEFDQRARRWNVPATDSNALITNALWPREQIIFRNEAAETVFNYLLLRFYQQTECARRVADFKINGVVPDMPDDWVDHPKWPATAYQRVAVRNLIESEGYGLFMKQGTGKTPPIISEICYKARRIYRKEGRMLRALIVCPKNVCRGWRNKFEQFAVTPGFVTILRGGALNRVKLLIEALKADEDSEYSVIICSYETLQRSWEAIRLLNPDICVLDESHSIKNHSTKRWAHARALRDLCVERRTLTGTPITNHIFDLWTQLEFLGKGMSGFTSYKAFKNYYGMFIMTDGGFEKLEDYQNLPILQERLARMGFFLTKEEADPNMPNKYYDIEYVDMTEEQAKYYMQLQELLAIQIQDELSKDTSKQLTVNHILTKLLRLSQITSGYLVWDRQIDEEGEIINPNNKERLPRNPKLARLIEMLSEKGPNEKTLVFTNWVECIHMIHEELDRVGIKHVVYYGGTNEKDREYAEQMFNNDPSIKVFLGNPAACKEGLDLHGFNEKDATNSFTNTTHVIYYSQNWSMVAREQSEDRAHRRITRHPVRVTDIIVPSTIDEEIQRVVYGKIVNANDIQNVKDIMERVLSTMPEIGAENEI